MEKVYGKKAQRNLARLQLNTMSQDEDQTLAEFYGNILRKAQEAYPKEDMDSDTIQSTLTTIFLHGILDKRASLSIINNRKPQKLYRAYKYVHEYQEQRDALVTTVVKKRAVKKLQVQENIEDSDSDDEFSVNYGKPVGRSMTDNERRAKRVAFLAEEAAKLVPSRKKKEKAGRNECFYCLADHMFRDCPVRLEDDTRTIEKVLELSKKQEADAARNRSASPSSHTKMTQENSSMQGDKSIGKTLHPILNTTKEGNKPKIRSTTVESDSEEL